MRGLALAAALAATTVYSADVVFSSGMNCTGRPLYGTRQLEHVGCHDVTGYKKPHGSVLLSNILSNQIVTFFADPGCQQPLAEWIDAGCFTPDAQNVQSFRVVTAPNGTTSLHSPNDVTSLDVYNRIKLTDYTMMSLMSPHDVNLIRLSTAVVAAIALLVTSTGLSLYAAVYACVATTGPDPAPLLACLAVPLAYIFALAAGAIGTYAIRPYTGTFQGGRVTTDSQGPAPARRMTIDEHNAAYMDWFTTAVDRKPLGAPVGYMSRKMDGVNHTSPLYEIEISRAGKWHLAAFYHEDSGTFVHHMHPAVEAEHVRRSTPYQYNSIEWGPNSGLDFTFCPAGQGSDTGLTGGSLQTLFETFYDQLTCELTQSQLQSAGQINGDLLNEYTTVRGTVAIQPYSQNKQVTVACPTSSSPLNEDCFVD